MEPAGQPLLPVCPVPPVSGPGSPSGPTTACCVLVHAPGGPVLSPWSQWRAACVLGPCCLVGGGQGSPGGLLAHLSLPQLVDCHSSHWWWVLNARPPSCHGKHQEPVPAGNAHLCCICQGPVLYWRAPEALQHLAVATATARSCRKPVVSGELLRKPA